MAEYSDSPGIQSIRQFADQGTWLRLAGSHADLSEVNIGDEGELAWEGLE